MMTVGQLRATQAETKWERTIGEHETWNEDKELVGAGPP